MNEDVNNRFQKVVKALEEVFGGGLDVQAILFLVGVQELGQGFKKFKKDEKLDLMHVAICTILEPYGYYEFEGFDTDKWPHFKLKDHLPKMNQAEQENLMKTALVNYFEKNEVYST